MSARQFMFFIILSIFLIHFTWGEKTWRQDRYPRISEEKILFKSIFPNRKPLQKKIVQYHNYFRTKVVPTASNMLKMKWNRRAAKAAQRWSTKCHILLHDDHKGRFVRNYGACGQNIFISTKKVPWIFAIKTWYLEKDNFTYSSPKNDLETIGHYTQLVWASTHKVGCGLSECHFGNTTRKFYNYICNYCPIGNKPHLLGKPYRAGESCELCPHSCHARKLCTNSCKVADLWSNCRELYKAWPEWLCNTNSKKGKERARHCRATCHCTNKIYD